ncbi:class I SAM-dependent methyltransferase [Pseudodesulfovibrio sp.]|uniref:class I SAM-dependent methyltransferase n=1 Tax=Pseudodesulfovibrio sp. TaxID=2035812 RepID=UPI002619A6CC|nr:class I SAM-dependent methyltransferase [Pseudodesulfovibrio sp.]MDD3312713.1 class I SAM-dependent methyltransferase [Pseudodesulfovibrio sp.]
MTPAPDEYARIAPHYDRVVGTFLRPVHRAVLDALPDPSLPLLDLCCGTGLLTAMAAAEGRQVVGLDLSPAMLARSGAGASGRFVLGDGAALPFASGRFGAVAICFALHEKPAPVRTALLAEAVRVLRPGGALLVADYRVPQCLGERLMGMGVALVERLAGREHFACFRAFRRAGGSRAELERAGLPALRTARFLGGAAGVYLARAGSFPAP